MFTSALPLISLSFLLNTALTSAQLTAAAQLAPRQTNSDPAFVGYISQSGGYSDARSCSYPQTVSTSGNYLQCCPTTGSCPFFTTCSDNTLIAAGATVDCYVDSALTCNTGIVQSTPGANGGPSYLACWQKTLGSGPFTFVQNVGSATTSGSGSSASSTSTRTAAVGGTSAASSAASRTSSGAVSSASSVASSATASSSAGAGAVVGEVGLGGAVGVMGLLVQALL